MRRAVFVSAFLLFLFAVILTAHGLTSWIEKAEGGKFPESWLPKELNDIARKYDWVYAYGSSNVDAWRTVIDGDKKEFQYATPTDVFFKGNTDQFNSFLADLAKAKPKGVTVFLSPDPGYYRPSKFVHEKDKEQGNKPYNWSLDQTTWRNKDGKQVGEPELSVVVHVQGDIQLDKIKLPAVFDATVGGRLQSFVNGHNERKAQLEKDAAKGGKKVTEAEPTTEELLSPKTDIFAPVTEESK